MWVNSKKLIGNLSALIFNPVAAIAAVLSCTAFLYLLERAAHHMPFVMLSVLGIVTVLFLLSSRIYFSLYTALAITVLLSIASVLKYRTKGFDLHIYDLVFTGTDPQAFAFLMNGFAAYILPVVVLMIGALIGLTLVFIAEHKARMSALRRSGMVAVTFALIPLSYPLAADEPRYFHYLGGFNASAFFVSFLDLRDAAIGRSISDRFAELPAARPFASPGPCEATGPKPDLFVVLSESQTDLSRLDQYGISQLFAQQFKSADGKRRELRVETFGGGTWVSNFSLMTGLSSLDFGWRAPYLTTTMEGKVHQSLATELSRCGYRTAVLMPMDHGFVNEGPFLESIGFDEVLDYNRIGASEYAHRDRFYFEAARAFIEQHRRTDGRPLFLEVQTMFAHSPYVEHLSDPDLELTSTSGNIELDEYLRRVAQSQKDFAWFLGQAEAESRDHPSIVLEFGDHQSFATREVVNHLYPDFAVNDLKSSAYRSYFTVHGMGLELNMAPFDFASLDIAYLGVSLIEAAGLGRSPMFADLAALRDRCEGKMHFCADRGSVDQHLQKRIASGYLTVQ
ncbi:sulfatase-like hydrolase/transferase [Hoeflea sp. YIM 152468]|uniref:sulfatase-like hydrolase/transferase n=1 Tax=Hoeflea sp. YIM 152468 TaxID=3031759 RepID=UPI0023D97C97|nr:sulfatase-like hydrolase/transferase [Hoeflea sp. YIM 152468]MDF1607870.1 sulfatase-like hydrolase/transferase [Hoeflea sp. YIM 152468]